MKERGIKGIGKKMRTGKEGKLLIGFFEFVIIILDNLIEFLKV